MAEARFMFIAAAIASLALLTRGGRQNALAEPRPPQWSLAIVFRREKGRRVYVGSVSKPTVPAVAVSTPRSQTSATVSRHPDAAADYEIWLAGDGATRGLWYSSARHAWGDMGGSGAGHHDDGMMKHLVRTAKPAVAEAPKVVAAQGTGLYPDPPYNLADLCQVSHVIAVGQVVGIVRNAHTPINSPLREQHTVFAFAVEQYLKTDTPGIRPIVKVWQTGGWLPWARPDGRAQGVGYEMADDPMLNVGSRYVLFLKLPGYPGDESRKLGYVHGAVAGIHGKVAELDEYIVTHHWRGKLLLRNGLTQAPRLLRDPEDHWRFAEGPQVLDVPEAAAIQAIRQEVTNQRGR